MLSVRPLERAVLVGLAAATFAAACGGTSTAASTIGSGALTGAGSTFTAPFYTKAFFAYTQKYPQVTINYQSVGSGAGIQQFIKQTVDFGASDVPMAATDIASAGGASSLVQFPTTLGVESITYNLAGVTKLQLDGTTLANIYLGHITKWNDPALAALNPGVSLPSTPISVVHRSDGSGTTYIFTDYLAKQSAEWKTKVGVSKSVSWPVGIGGSGNQGVAQAVISTAGAIGYVELAYVVQAKMAQAYLKNKDGQYLQASLDGASAAAAQKPGLSATDFSITDEPGATSYPIAGFTWAFIRTSIADANKGKAVVYLFKWLVTDGQTYATSLQYAPLPTSVQNLALTSLSVIKAGGQTVLS
ncbi:MAG TPA: phosphate ABC transporter substrate-binding protein PstS [Clostridia bacterium]|nr:phosphate ABC transporter substrate-binding protein PstS [Clostridia bacterium]